MLVSVLSPVVAFRSSHSQPGGLESLERHAVIGIATCAAQHLRLTMPILVVGLVWCRLLLVRLSLEVSCLLLRLLESQCLALVELGLAFEGLSLDPR